jgi:hypothetical protein
MRSEFPEHLPSFIKLASEPTEASVARIYTPAASHRVKSSHVTARTSSGSSVYHRIPEMQILRSSSQFEHLKL